MEIREFIEARLAEDERAAVGADPGPWEVGPTFGARDNRVYVREAGNLIDSVGTCVFAAQVASKTQFRQNAVHIARHDPARVLREVAAKRAVIADLDRARAQQKQHPKDLATTGWMLGMMRALDFLALAWEDHPDYDPAWRING